MADQRDGVVSLPGLPPPETLQAYAEQSTDEVRAEARRYAESRLPLLRKAGIPFPKNYPTELVNDALSATWLGEEPWDPASCSLLVHLRGAILARTYNDVRRGLRFRRLTIDLPSNDPQWTKEDKDLLYEHERYPAHASFGDAHAIMICSLAVRVCGELRRIAAGDTDAQAILACWETGVIEAGQVMKLTGLSEQAYAAARKRLLYVSKYLPPDIREAVADLLRSAS